MNSTNAEREKIFGHNRDKNCSHKKRKRESASVFVCDAWRRGKQTNDRKSDIFIPLTVYRKDEMACKNNI